MTRYSRKDVLRILHLRARQLTAWEQAGLIPPNEQYSFEDLAQLRTLRALRATRITAKNVLPCLLMFAAAFTQAQGFPDKTIRIVTTEPGSTSDFLAPSDQPPVPRER